MLSGGEPKTAVVPVVSNSFLNASSSPRRSADLSSGELRSADSGRACSRIGYDEDRSRSSSAARHAKSRAANATARRPAARVESYNKLTATVKPQQWGHLCFRGAQRRVHPEV
eukprot:1025127-Prymnesium_polylepis.1